MKNKTISSMLKCKLIFDVVQKEKGTSSIAAACTKRSKVLITIRC